jgi:hypothetical protein
VPAKRKKGKEPVALRSRSRTRNAHKKIRRPKKERPLPPLPANYGPDSINFDDGFCNPNKLQNLEDEREKAIGNLIDRDYTEDEARAKLAEDSG